MNEDQSISCTESSCNEALTDHHEETLTTAQPLWSADRTDDGVEIEVTLPGVPRNKLDLEVEGRELRLSARRSAGNEERRVIVGQAAPDAYALKLRLGPSLDGGRLTATLKDGILKVSVPLASEARPRSIAID